MKIICWACISIYFDLQWTHFKRITSILLCDFLLKIMIFADLQKRSGSKKRKAADFGQFSNFLKLLAVLFMICPLCCLKSLSGYLFWKRGIRTECDSCFFKTKKLTFTLASLFTLSDIEIAWYVLFCVVSATGGGPLEDILWATETRGGCQRWEFSAEVKHWA